MDAAAVAVDGVAGAVSCSIAISPARADVTVAGGLAVDTAVVFAGAAVVVGTGLHVTRK